MSMSKSSNNSCRFCEIAAGNYSDAVDRPWLTDSSYLAIASLGMLVPGWSLVIPKAHGLNLATHYEQEHFWHFSDQVARIVSSRYGQVVAFEHGSSFVESPTSCGTSHAHLHIVPFAADLEQLALKRGGRAWQRCAAKDIDSIVNGKEYLFASSHLDGANTVGQLTILEQPVSQFFRSVIAQHLGKPSEYNYRSYPQLQVARDAQAELESFAAGHSSVAA